MEPCCEHFVCAHMAADECLIGHVNNIPIMQFFTGITRNTQPKSYMLSLTECVWDFQNNALWETLITPFSPIHLPETGTQK